MAHCNTIFSQILKFVPRHEFETLANKHHSGRAFRTASRWSQFVTIALSHLAGRNSLRDIVESISSQAHRIYHLGCAKLSRSNLSRINEDKPYTLYEALFGKLLSHCQVMSPGHGFCFKNPLYSMDASTIDLCLTAFPWADFRSTKGAIKLYVGLNHADYLPVRRFNTYVNVCIAFGLSPDLRSVCNRSAPDICRYDSSSSVNIFSKDIHTPF